jgi:hypothetical protein
MNKSNWISPDAPFTDKVMFGLKLAIRKMVEEAALHDESLVIGNKNETFKLVPAKELLKILPE